MLPNWGKVFPREQDTAWNGLLGPRPLDINVAFVFSHFPGNPVKELTLDMMCMQAKQ